MTSNEVLGRLRTLCVESKNVPQFFRIHEDSEIVLIVHDDTLAITTDMLCNPSMRNTMQIYHDVSHITKIVPATSGTGDIGLTIFFDGDSYALSSFMNIY